MARPFLVAACLVVGTARAASADAPVDDDYKKAIALYEGSTPADSIPYFERAYAKTRAPQALYGLAVAELGANRCAAALPHFRMYLDTNPSPESRKDTQDYILGCWQRLPVGTRVVVGDHGTGGGSGVPFYKSIGALGVYTGALSFGVGVAFMFKASSARDAANDAQYADDFDARLDDATGKRRVGISLMVTGGLLAAGGLTYYFMTRSTETPSTSVAVTPTSIWVARAF